MEIAMLKILLVPIVFVALTSFLYYWISVSVFPLS